MPNNNNRSNFKLWLNAYLNMRNSTWVSRDDTRWATLRRAIKYYLVIKHGEYREVGVFNSLSVREMRRKNYVYSRRHGGIIHTVNAGRI